MKIFQRMHGKLATNLYIDRDTAELTRLNVKTGTERKLSSFKTSSVDEALRAAEDRFGKMTEVKTMNEAKTASRTFRTARRKLSMQEKLRLINEDRLEDDDFDL